MDEMPEERKELLNGLKKMSERIYELQSKSEKLTNGQRYAAINEIEKNIAPLRKDLNRLERKLYRQETNDVEINKDIDQILLQISELENIKSDLVARINTETEHTRTYYHNEVMNFMKTELKPLKDSIQDNQNEINEVKESIADLRKEIKETQYKQDLENAKRVDKFKEILTVVIAILAALSAVSIYFQPAIQTLLRILFGF